MGGRSVNGPQGVQAVTNHIRRFVSFVAPFAAITVKVAVDAYFLTVDLIPTNGQSLKAPSDPAT